MKLKFDKDQSYQLQAIESLVGLFDGQKLGQGEFVLTQDTAFMGSTVQTELGLGNPAGFGEGCVAGKPE